MGFPRQEYWSGLPFPSPEYLPNPGIEPMSPASPILAGRFFTTWPPGKPVLWYFYLTFECSNTKYPTNNINFKTIVMESINVHFFTHILPTYIYIYIYNLHATDSNIFHIIAYFSVNSKTKHGISMYFLTTTHTTRMLWNFIKVFVWLFAFSL